MSRTVNSLRNAAGSLGGQMAAALLRFACRTVFLRTLGAEFLGISSLYTNVLTILSISELGISTVITYSLYEPLAREDWQKVRSLMDFYKKAYRAVALAILVIGLALMPFLPRLMTGVTDKVNIYHYYLLYLAQSVVSYGFFAYKQTLLIADQKKYLVDAVTTLGLMAVNLLQILSMLVLRSFLVYTLLSVVTAVVQNGIAAWLTDRRYPQLKGPAPKLEKGEKRRLFAGTYALFLQRISTAIGTAGGNLIISSFISVTAVGIYNNYSLIVTTVQSFFSSVFRSLTASLGNLMTESDRAHNRLVYRSLQLACCYLVALCSACFLTVFQSFIRLWAGEEYLLEEATVILIVANFATNYLQTVVLIYRDAAGLFVYGKYRSVVNAALNLGLSLVLVQYLGMSGVFLGAIISRMVTVWWFDGWVLYRKCFDSYPWWYYFQCVLCLGVGAGAGALCMWLAESLGTGWWQIAVALMASAAAVTAVYALLFGTSPETAYLKTRFSALVKRKKS